MNGYMTVQETAEKWGVTSRQVQILCKDNRISGATKLSRIWIIPEEAEKPTTDIIHDVDDAKREAAVYNANFLGGHFSFGDIKNVSGGSLPAAHLSWASFPCQDLSLAGNQKGIFAERSGLVWEWLRVFDEMKEKPRVIALENVAGLLSSNDGENYRSLHNALIQRGYKCGAV